MEQEYQTKSPSTTPSTTPKPYRKNPKRPSIYVRRASAADIGQADDQAPEYQKELNRRLSEGRLSMIIRGDELQEDTCYNNFGKLLQNHTFHVRNIVFFSFLLTSIQIIVMFFVLLDCAFVSCEIVYLGKQDAYTECCADNSTYWKGYDFVRP